MGQNSSDILQEESFQVQLYVQTCKINAEQLHREIHELRKKASLLSRSKHHRQSRLVSLLQTIVRKGIEADHWDTRASQLDNFKHRLLVAGTEADITKALVRVSRVLRKPTFDPVDLDRELAMLDDDLTSYGAGGREVMESNEGEAIDVSDMLRELQDEASVMHDLPLLVASGPPVIGGVNATSLGRGIR